MPGYYRERLSAERLRACYEIASPRVRDYLEAEIQFVLGGIGPAESVLELGCGYGRVLGRLLPAARAVTGIDTSRSSLELARTIAGPTGPPRLLLMDASRMAFRDGSFDRTICIQNGICALDADRLRLFREAVRVTRRGGAVLFSSYSARFWDDRLQWFEEQAAHGLIGPIDREATGDGVIVCRDGFRATTAGPDEFRKLAAAAGVEARLTEVDGSSLFCEVTAP